MPDSLIYFGDAVKTKADGKIGGYLVRFSNSKNPDVDGDFFTKETDFGFTGTIKSAIYFNHRMPLKTADGKTVREKAKIGEATLSIDDEGVLIEEAVIYNRKRYEKMLDHLGWSSGSAPHLVDSVKVGNANQILTWPLGLDASLTPIPAQPYKTQAMLSMKSLDGATFSDLDEDEPQPIPDKPTGLAAKLNQHIDDLADDKDRPREKIVSQMANRAGIEVKAVEAILTNQQKPSRAQLKAFADTLNVSFEVLEASTRRDHLQTIKGMFEDAIAEKTPSRWELESIYCGIIKKLANAASAAQMAGVKFDLAAKVNEATSEYTALLKKHAMGQITEWMEEGGNEDFYLKAILDSEASIKSLHEADLDTHSQFAVSALGGLIARYRANYEARVKVGRPISERNRSRIENDLSAIETSVSDIRQLLKETQPMATESQKRAAKTAYLRNQWRTRKLGVTANG